MPEKMTTPQKTQDRRLMRKAFKEKVKAMKKAGQIRKDVPMAILFQQFRQMQDTIKRVETSFAKHNTVLETAPAHPADEFMSTIDQILDLSEETLAQPVPEEVDALSVNPKDVP